MDYAGIGRRIRRYRKLRNLSQEQLAAKVDISLPHMSHIETGLTKLSLKVLVDIAVALGTSTDSLLFDAPALSRAELAQMVLSAPERQVALLGRMFSCIKESL